MAEGNKGDGFKPTKSMIRAAERALEIRAKLPPSKRAMTAVGLARARDIKNGKNLSFDTVKRMFSYLSRAMVNYDPKDPESKGSQAVLGWGGPSGLIWARHIIEMEEARRERE